jgi:4-hydroxy-L-threonine phosphate dehydrogenase PdxA
MAKTIALTLGDRYGVGPELVAKLAHAAVAPDLRIVVVGDGNVFAHGRQIIGLGELPCVASFYEAAGSDENWSFLDRPFDAGIEPLGRVSAEAGREVLDTLGFLVEASQRGDIHGIVYAPLNKQAMRLGGHSAGDELEFFVSHMRPQNTVGEVNILGDLWTSRVTSHVPLRAVGDLITVDRILASIRLLDRSLKQSGRVAPRLAIAALNPHAGEGGAFGCEEIDVIAPAVAAARAEGINAQGPYPADTIFPRAVGGAFDGVVTMFHDQGQIALKMVGLGKGITFLAGFPVPIATPGHGTAYDIAGTGTARVDGLAAALALVARMVGGMQ